jgi:hypothetical protein
MVYWWWILIVGFGGFLLGVFAICIFITGGREAEGPQEDDKSHSWY